MAQLRKSFAVYPRTNYEPAGAPAKNDKPGNPEEPYLNNNRQIKWKREYQLKSTAALVARKRDFKTLTDIRNAIDSPVFESDEDLLSHIIHTPLGCCGQKYNRPGMWFLRWVWRIITINGTTPYVWMKIMNGFSSPAIIAVMSTVLHAKDVVESSTTVLKTSNIKGQAIDPAQTAGFIQNIGLSLLIILGIVLTMELLWKIQYLVVITVKRHRTILRETRFEQLQADYDFINPYGNHWVWDYNAYDEDPDLAMIYFQYIEEYEHADRNCCGVRYEDTRNKMYKKMPFLKFVNPS